MNKLNESKRLTLEKSWITIKILNLLLRTLMAPAYSDSKKKAAQKQQMHQFEYNSTPSKANAHRKVCGCPLIRTTYQATRDLYWNQIDSRLIRT